MKKYLVEIIGWLAILLFSFSLMYADTVGEVVLWSILLVWEILALTWYIAVKRSGE